MAGSGNRSKGSGRGSGGQRAPRNMMFRTRAQSRTAMRRRTEGLMYRAAPMSISSRMAANESGARVPDSLRRRG